MDIQPFLEATFSPYISDPKWYPFILIGIALLILFLLFLIFLYIRSFLSWLFGVNELIRIGREQNHLLSELIAIQNEQQELFQALFIENSVTKEANDAAESENNENPEDSEEKSEKK